MSKVKHIFFYIGILLLMTGCTSILTAPLNVTGNVVTHPGSE